MRGGPTVTNSSLWLPGGRGLTPVEKDLLLKSPRLVKVAKRVKVGRDTLRVRALDLKRKGSDQRHFKAQFRRTFQSHAGDPNPAEGMEMRYAELMGIYEATVGRQEPVVLLRGRWFPAAAKSFHRPSQNMVLETGRAWDPVEPMVEARRIVGMVVLAPFPVMPGVAAMPGAVARSVVLDKLLDTMAEVDDKTPLLLA
jgi:hypothetical protein